MAWRTTSRTARGLLAAGAILLLVALLAGSAGAVQAEEDRFEPNDDPDNATQVEPGFYENVSVGESGSDWYAVDLEEGEHLYVGAFFDLWTSGNLELYLLAPDGDELRRAATNFDDEHLLTTAPETGTYTLLVDGPGPDTGDYDLEIQTGNLSLDPREPDTNRRTATPLFPGSYDDLAIRHAADVDTYTVYLEANQTMTASAVFDRADGNLDVVVRGREGDPVAESRTTDDGESVEFEPAETGTYTVEVAGVDGATNDYDLEASIEGGLSWSAWLSESLYWAGTPPLDDGTLTGQDLGDSQSVDSYAIRATAGERVNATITRTNASTPTVAVLDPARTLVEQGNGSVTFEPTRDGVYYLEVVNWSEPVSYDLRLDGTRPWSQATDEGDADGLPGFGVPAALAALLAVATYGRWR